jgi:Fe-S cluster biogenesis protein NfuA/nitrite reductase/ring-hydroxylating ferredoxin subunit
MQEDASAALIDRVQALTAQLEAVHDVEARVVADELVASIMQLYGAGLERIFEALDVPGASAAAVRDELVGDGVVASLMLIHGLYPVPLDERVREALASVRPYMESHGGDVELVALVEGVAHLRLVGHCRGCPASEATLELAIKQALDEAAPDLEGLEVEGVREPATANGNGFALPIVQSGAPPDWIELDAEPPAAGTIAPVTVGGAELLVANVGGTLLAYVNACGSCGTRLDTAPMTPGGTLACPACDGRFELRRAGRSPDDDALQIAPVPLLRGGGRVRVAVGAA